MKRIKSIHGFTIYEATTQRDADNYGCHVGNFNIYTSTDIRDFGLTNSYPGYEDIDSLAEAIAICSGSHYAVAAALADELSDLTYQDMDLTLEIERRLESGDALETVRRCYDRETGRLYESISDAIAHGYDPYANDEFDPYEDHPAMAYDENGDLHVVEDECEWDDDDLDGDLEDVFEAAMGEDLNMGSEPDEVDLLCRAMRAAGYAYDGLNSDGLICFYGEWCDRQYFVTWQAVREWLEGVVFDDPEVSDAVERILHPEHFSGRTWLDAVREQYIEDCHAPDDDDLDGDPEANKNNWRVSDRLTDDLRDELAEGIGCYDTIEEIENVGMWGLASLELGYGCIEVNVTRPEGDAICAEYFVCLQEADGEWFSHGYIDRLVTIDWSAPDWEDRLHYEMYDELLRYANEQDWDLTTPFVEERDAAYAGEYVAEQCPVDPEPEAPKQERRSHASYYVTEDSDGVYITRSIGYPGDLTPDQYRKLFFHKLSELVAFNDLYDERLDEVVYDGEPCHYTGWQPGMVIEFASDITGEIIYSCCHPEWDH